MPGLLPTEIADFVNLTRADEGVNNLVEIATQHRRFVMFKDIMGMKKRKEKTGTRIEYRVLVSTGGYAQGSGLMDQDTLMLADGTVVAQTDWRYLKAGYPVDRRLLSQQNDATRIFDYIKEQESMMTIDVATRFENQSYLLPDDPNDPGQLFGIPSHVVKNATAGQTGGNPAGFSSGIGVNRTTYPNAKNFSRPYVVASRDDLLERIRELYLDTDFQSPTDLNDFREGKGDMFQIHCGNTPFLALEKTALQQNSSAGADLGEYDDNVVYKKCKIINIPQLNSDTSDPVYLLNFNWLYFAYDPNFFFKKDISVQSAQSHNVVEAWMDLVGNWVCENGRMQGVTYKV